MGQTRLERLSSRRGQGGFYAPVFARIKGFDFHLALDNQAQANGLHAARRFSTGQFAPQNRRQIKAHQIIQRAPRQIGLHQRHIHLARVFHRLGDGSFGDGVKHYAANRCGFFYGFTLAQRFFQMPADRLALAVGVGRQNQFIVVFQGICNGFDVLAGIISNFPCHGEFVVGIDRSVL